MIGQRRLQDEMIIISILGFGASYIRDFTVITHMFKVILFQLSGFLNTNEVILKYTSKIDKY